MVTIDQFMNSYNEGLSDSKISKEYKCCRKSISKLRNSLNLPRMSKVQQYNNEIRNLVNLGYSDQRISKELNISHSMIGYIRKRLKIKTNFVERTYKNQYDRKRGYMIRNIKYSAQKRNIEFNLDFSQIELPVFCPILNIKLEYFGDSQKSNHATVDRINNNLGYVPGNIMVMSRMANAMKNEASFGQLKLFSENIKLITNYYENRGALGSITDIFPDIKLYDENLISTPSRCTFKDVSI
jgi:DNA-binding CsgD family transcriptional regulator